MNPKDRRIEFTAIHVKNMVDVIDDLLSETGVLFNQNQFSRYPESIAEKEKRLVENPESLETTYSIATISMESAADHLFAFCELLREPVKTLAPYTCVRSLMEMSALACWLLDPAIDARTRLGRTFAHRYSEFLEQRKTLRKDNSQLERIRIRIEKVEGDALKLGFRKLRNKKGEICGIAQPHPSIIELIDQTFGKEFEYRLLSGIAHGQLWALQQAGFKLVEHEVRNGNKIRALTKVVVPNIAIYFGMVAVVCFSRVLFAVWTLFGWEQDEILTLLESIFDRLGYSEAIRFWRSPGQ